jgi:translation initiation factor IF-2
MSEQKPTRLAKAATYFNVGREEILDYLISKGFSIDNNPNAKIEETMFAALNEKFSSEHDQRAESSLLGKNKEEAELSSIPSIEIEEKKTIIKEEAAVEIPKVEPVMETPVVVEEKIIQEESNTIEKSEVKLTGPKIIGKVSLDDLTPKKKKSKQVEVIEETKIEKENDIIVAPENIEIEVKKTEEIIEIIEEKVATLSEIEETVVEQNTITEKEVEQTENELNKDEDTSVEHIKTNFQKLKGAQVLGTINLDEFKKEPKPKVVPPSTNNNNKKRTRIKETGGNPDKTRVKFDNVQKNTAFKKPVKTDKPLEKQDAPNVLTNKEIEENIRKTEARMNASLSKGTRQKIRKKKREELNEKNRLNEEVVNEKLLKITEFITVSDLASLMNISPTQIITFCFGMGVVVSINQRLDAEIIELITSEFEFEVEFISLEDANQVEEEIDNEEDLESRAPIVTIMGHVDHGKTSLLDYIRRANVANKEAGGITQHIGAYDVMVPKHDRKITFIDTPGHEAFTAMRARGAKLTDVAVIVIAADDKVMPQTKEAISHAQSANVPMIFALNKIDKDGANPDGVRSQLSEMNLLVESWGGKFQEQEISAKKGIGIDELLEKILLESDMLELKANPKKLATGTVIEASLDKGRGYVATVLVLGGTLNIGDFIVAGSCFGKIKAMTDHLGNKLTKVLPGEPVQILGLNGAPSAGETFREYNDEQEAKQIAYKRSQIEREQGMRTKKHITLDEIGRRLALGTFKELNIIIKGDVDGSVQALTDSLIKLSTDEIQVNVLHRAVGAISESDVLLATASDAIIIGFQVRPSAQAKLLAEKESIDIRHYSVIYQAIDEVKAAMEGMLEPTIEEKITGNLEVLEIFKIPKVGTIAGCMVKDGKVYKNSKVRVIREGIVVYSGTLDSLKRFKDDVKEVVHGQDCGMNIKNYNDVMVGDIIEAYEEIEIKRTL